MYDLKKFINDSGGEDYLLISMTLIQALNIMFLINYDSRERQSNTPTILNKQGSPP